MVHELYCFNEIYFFLSFPPRSSSFPPLNAPRSSALSLAPKTELHVFNAPKVKTNNKKEKYTEIYSSLSINYLHHHQQHHHRHSLLHVWHHRRYIKHTYKKTTNGSFQYEQSEVKLGSVVLVDGFRGNRRMPRFWSRLNEEKKKKKKRMFSKLRFINLVNLPPGSDIDFMVGTGRLTQEQLWTGECS